MTMPASAQQVRRGHARRQHRAEQAHIGAGRDQPMECRFEHVAGDARVLPITTTG